jgi:hypothetical protein
MRNLIITPVYKSYDIVREMAEAIEKFTVNPYLHVMVDDDSDIGEFPVKPSANRRIIMMKRDYTGLIHKNGLGQALQLGYDYAHQAFFNEGVNPLPYDHIFVIEADVIVEADWDQKMIDIIPTLPEDWLSLDQQSVDKEGKTTYPTTVSIRLGFERPDLEIMKYPDYQCCVFNPKIFEAGIKFSDAASHFDITMGRQTEEKFHGRHFRTMLVKSMHYTYSSRQFLNEIPKS